MQYPTHNKCSINIYWMSKVLQISFLPSGLQSFALFQSSCHYSSQGTYHLLLSINNTLTYPVLAHKFQSIRVQLLLSKLPKIPAYALSLFKSSPWPNIQDERLVLFLHLLPITTTWFSEWTTTKWVKWSRRWGQTTAAGEEDADLELSTGSAWGQTA